MKEHLKEQLVEEIDKKKLNTDSSIKKDESSIKKDEIDINKIDKGTGKSVSITEKRGNEIEKSPNSTRKYNNVILKPKPDTDSKYEKLLCDIRKKYGNGAVMTLNGTDIKFDSVSTGSPSLDNALGGGIPSGRIIEIYGHESSGKSTLALCTAGQAQNAGKTVAYIDSEHALDPAWARKMGVDIEKLLLSQPDSAEEALGIASMMIDSDSIGLIVIDSVAALVPKAELQGEIGDFTVGLQARIMSQALRRISGSASSHDCAIIFINQIREKVGVVFGNPETTPGGRALKFFSTVRIEVRRREILKKGDEIYGVTIKAKIVKNKVAPPFKTAEIELLYDSGINRETDIINLGLEKGFLKKCGTWLYYEDLRLGQGKEQAGRKLREMPEILHKIEDFVFAA
jgi:recombination protein RecA